MLTQICQLRALPFSRLQFQGNGTQFGDICYGLGLSDSTYVLDNDGLVHFTYRFLRNFNDPNWVQDALDVSMFFANGALLRVTADNTGAYTARTISTSPGYSLPKPAKTLAGTIVISLLILVQVVALFFLVMYIYSDPRLASSRLVWLSSVRD